MGAKLKPPISDVHRSWDHATRLPTYQTLDPARRAYVRIMEASQHGRGVKLTADEVEAMAMDDAIGSAAYAAVFED